MKRVLVMALVTAMMVPALPLNAAGPAPSRIRAQDQTGGIAGNTTSSTGQALPNYTVQLRNLQTGQLVGSTTSNATGSFTFTGLAPTTYVVEVVDSTGAIVGSSSAIPVVAGQTVTITVSATAAAAGAGAGAAAGAGGATSAGLSAPAIIAIIAAAGGVAAAVAVAVNGESSPSR